METTDRSTTERSTTPFPNVPPIIESDDREYRDPGVPSTVTIVAGHPLHPLTMIFPIAFLAGALGTDVGYWLTRDPFWARASLWLVGVGLASGVVAAITGMGDFLRIERVRKRIAGWAHMILNVTLLLLTAVNLILRLDDYVAAVLPWGLILSIIVSSLISVSGWYGTELSYRHKIGVIGSGSQHQP
jgi:uncharacterized membrane protein